jgi:hypothetical protein
MGSGEAFNVLSLSQLPQVFPSSVGIDNGGYQSDGEDGSMGEEGDTCGMAIMVV